MLTWHADAFVCCIVVFWISGDECRLVFPIPRVRTVVERLDRGDSHVAERGTLICTNLH